MDHVLSDVDVRVLGSLIEKEITTPEYYPLSLNALTNACNQTSNRDPVVHYDDTTVKAAVDRLRKYSLVRSIQRVDARVMKYSHLLSEAMGLERPELATMCVLMLRGPQTVGELRTRGNRLFEFQSLEEVEATLNGLAARSLAIRLPRQPGQKEARYAHLLSGDVKIEPELVPPTSPVEFVRETDHVLALQRMVIALQTEVADLRAEVAELRRLFE